MSGILAALAGIKTAIATAVDEYFNRVTLLLNTSSTNGAQNNTFLDSSTNNFTITRNGNTTQGTFTPFSQTGWSIYQSALASTYLNFTTSPGTLFQYAGDFTVEMWIFPIVLGSGESLWVTNDGSANYFALNVDTTNYQIYTNTSTASSSFAHGISLNQWNHVAMVRSGSTITLYTNGVSKGTITNSSTLGYANPSLNRNGGGGSTVTLYMSNLRIVKSAVYTSAFTPPTTPLTNIANTSLLTCQSNRFVDNSSNALVATVTGEPSVQAFSPFLPTAAYDTAVVGGSGYFDGSGDYLTCSVSASPTGTQNFTIEGWVYVPSAATEYAILANNNSSGGFYLRVNSSGQINVVHTNIAGIIVSSSSVKANSWNYFCVTRSGNTFNIYLNSTSVDATTSNSVSFATGTSTVVGADYAGGVNFRSYMSSLRVVIGTATAPSAVPTAPFTAITNTSLLLNFTNAGIYDSASKNVLETVGNAQVSTTQAKWGTTSMYFDGTGDYLAIPSGYNLGFGTGDFTIETWVYPTLITGDERVLLGHGSGSTNWFSLYITSSATVEFAYILSNSAVIDVTTTSTVSLNTWTHIALVRNGTSFKIYINGTDGGSSSSPTTTSSAISNFSDDFRIGGARWNGGSDVFQGYMDDFRISKYARYTANFTAPTAAFSLQ